MTITEERVGKWSKLLKQLKEDDEEEDDGVEEGGDEGDGQDAGGGTTKAEDSRTEFAGHSDGLSGTIDRVSGKCCVLIGQVKINGEKREMLELAAEQFGGKHADEITRICLETMEGHQRAIMGQ